MSVSDRLLKDGRKSVVIVGAGAAGMVEIFSFINFAFANVCSLVQPPSPSIQISLR